MPAATLAVIVSYRIVPYIGDGMFEGTRRKEGRHEEGGDVMDFALNLGLGRMRVCPKVGGRGGGGGLWLIVLSL